MARPRFHLTPEKLALERVYLDGQEARHVGVRRLKTGQEVSLFDAAGGEATGRVERVREGVVELAVIDRPVPLPQPRLRIILGLGLIRWERLRLAVEKATELGVSAVWPLLTARTRSFAAARQPKLKRVVIEALKQCHRSQGPVIEAAMSLEEALKRSRPVQDKIILLRFAPPLARMFETSDLPEEVLVLVGPEGGFTAAEVEAAGEAGFRPGGLTPAILRTETAALAAVSLIQALWGEEDRERKT
ncbi:MAG: 16S rRNA (uracil(1498)-N(3))-methyltransferase [Deltaproteobacteria bacterium]|nr:16S rRNA (uracil(1498)-N(3))-methyltransferase [Deltaproteobacteria bacterium]